jgi:hypothetical protein
MFDKTESSEDICGRFNSMHWHDSKLTGFHLKLRDDDQIFEVGLDLRLLTDIRPGNYQWENQRLEIKECRLIKLDLDLLGMQLCGGDIASATCEKDSAMKRKVERDELPNFSLPQGEDPLAGILHFRILLIHPGGEINLFAKGFNVL